MTEGEKVKEYRLKIGLSQAKLAKLTGLKQSTLSAWELNKCAITKKEIRDIKATIDKLNEEKVNKLKKKQFVDNSKNSDVIIPQRGFKKTSRNKEYISQLKGLEKSFKDAEKPFKAMSFFAGCGGLCYGVKAAGFDIIATNELVDGYKDIYSLNFPEANFLPNDVQEIPDELIESLVREHGSVDLMVGGPPCQGFSLAGKRDVNDSRNTLFEDYLHIASLVKPKVVLIENVKLLTSMKDPNGTLVKDRITKRFSELNYKSSFFVVNAKNYGVAQHRERVIFIGVRDDLKKYPTIPDPIYNDGFSSMFESNPQFTFGDAVSDLEYLESGDKSVNDAYHWAVKHPNHVLKWMVNVKQGMSAHENNDPDLRPPSGYNTTYKRQVWEEPAGTVATTFGMISGCRNVHPIATRSMTIREALRIQSFPDSFKLCGTSGNMRTVIGNAVPPLLGFHLAKHIRESYM